MYSLVLMAALTTGGETPDFHFKGRSNGCAGCYGCWGWGGCQGSCHGYGGGYGGCHGACYGGYGGCHGGCYGGNCYGYHNLYAPTACYGCYGCYGCWGCWGCAGTSGYAPMYSVPAAPMPPAEKKIDGAGIHGDRGRLVVEVPADATLTIDDQPTKATSEKRVFNTPTLLADQTYYYILKVEVVREGTAVSETRRVLIRPGEETRAAFTETGIVAWARSNTSTAKK